MVGNTGRKCISQGINVIAGGSQSMRYSFKPSLSQKSSKFDQQIQQIVPKSTSEHNMWDWIYISTVDKMAKPLATMFPITLRQRSAKELRLGLNSRIVCVNLPA